VNGNQKKFPILMRECWFGLNQAFRRKLDNLALTTVQYTVLRTICESCPDNLNQQEIARSITTHKNNLTPIIKRLVELNYIELRSNPCDKREKKILINAKGKKVYREAKSIALTLQTDLLRDFTDKEKQSISNYLERCNNQMEDISRLISREIS
jgi:DNA-binding MarR family transcriptional regulator